MISAEGWGLLHFGYNNIMSAVADKPTLLDVYEQWRQATGIKDNDSHTWVRELVIEIWNSRKNRKPNLDWQPFKSALAEKEGYVYPVLVHIHKFGDGKRRYDIYTFLFQEPSLTGKGQKKK